MSRLLQQSIYIEDHPIESDHLNKTEEIMKEPDSINNINQSTHRKSMGYHPFEKTIVGISDYFSQQAVVYPINVFRQREKAIYNQPQPFAIISIEKKKERSVQRPCHNPFKNMVQQHQQVKLPVDPNWIEKRDKLSNKYKSRKQQKFDHLKEQLSKRIQYQAKQQDQSSIQSQIIQDSIVKQQRINNFLKRQSFYAQEKKILREMREFCIYGAIRRN